jgi:hypothetical protein
MDAMRTCEVEVTFIYGREVLRKISNPYLTQYNNGVRSPISLPLGGGDTEMIPNSDVNTWHVMVFWHTEVSEGHVEDGGSTVLRNIGILPHLYTASQLRRPRLEYIPRFESLETRHTWQF